MIRRLLSRLSVPMFVAISAAPALVFVIWAMTLFGADEHETRVFGITFTVALLVWVALAWTWITARERRRGAPLQ